MVGCVFVQDKPVQITVHPGNVIGKIDKNAPMVGWGGADWVIRITPEQSITPAFRLGMKKSKLLTPGFSPT